MHLAISNNSQPLIVEKPTFQNMSSPVDCCLDSPVLSNYSATDFVTMGVTTCVHFPEFGRGRVPAVPTVRLRCIWPAGHWAGGCDKACFFLPWEVLPFYKKARRCTNFESKCFLGKSNSGFPTELGFLEKSKPWV